MKRWIIVGVLVVLVVAGGAAWYCLGPVGADPSDGIDTWFTDVTDSAGIDFVHDAGDLSKYLLTQIHGSGVALFDFDGDGLVDIYLLTHGGPGSGSINRLYKNMGDGTFNDVTAGSGLGIAGYCTGVAIGDVNNDGWPDVLVAGYGGVRLFLNNGNGNFTDVTGDSGLNNPLWATSCSFVDYDRDGWLDLVVVNYLEQDPSVECHNPSSKREFCGPLVYPPLVTKLFRNLGPGARGRVAFQDVTVKSGLASAPAPGLGVYCADFDGDGWPDIFVANDARPNHLWMNQRNGTFKEEAYLRGLAVNIMGQAQAGMGVAAGDVEGNGLFSIYVTHLTTEYHALWMQGPSRGTFRDRTAEAGLLASDWRGTGFGTLMGDFDNDGWLDIAVVNGRIAQGTATPNPALGFLMPYGERNQLFRNEGKAKFRDVSRWNRAFCGTPNAARGLAAGDLNGHGALDLVVTTVAGRARVYRNVAKDRGHWLLVRAFDPRLKRDAYGAEIVVQAGQRKWLRIVNPSASYQSSSDARAHFGLGSRDRFDSIHILWPDGLSEVFPGGSTDRALVLERGKGSEERPRK